MKDRSGLKISQIFLANWLMVLTRKVTHLGINLFTDMNYTKISYHISLDSIAFSSRLLFHLSFILCLIQRPLTNIRILSYTLLIYIWFPYYVFTMLVDIIKS